MSNFCGFVLLSFVFTTRQGYGSSHLGGIVIDNSVFDAESIDDTLLIVSFSNECTSGLSISSRASSLLTTFPCLSLMENTTVMDLSSYQSENVTQSFMIVNTSDNSCMEAEISGMDDFCIDYLSYNVIYDNDTLDDCGVADSLDSWSLDQLDGWLPDNTFEYYYFEDSTETVDIYVMDSGIQGDHDDFYNGQIKHIFGPDWAWANVHGTTVASVIGGIVYGVALGNQNIYDANVWYWDDGKWKISRVNMFNAFWAIFQKLVSDTQSGTNKRGVLNLSISFKQYDDLDIVSIDVWFSLVMSKMYFYFLLCYNQLAHKQRECVCLCLLLLFFCVVGFLSWIC